VTDGTTKPAQAKTSYPAIVGHVLAAVRRRRKLSQTEVARAVGLGQPAWSKVERGATAATVEQLAGAGGVLRVTPGTLLRLADSSQALAQTAGIAVDARRCDPGDVAVVGTSALRQLVGKCGALDQLADPDEAAGLDGGRRVGQGGPKFAATLRHRVERR